MKKLLAIAVLLVMILSAAAYAEEDGQNPVMNLIGMYMDETSGRASMEIRTLGAEGGAVTISWADSAFQTVVWTFSGTLNEEGSAFIYEDCTKAIFTYDEEGNGTSEILYENGTGRLLIAEDWSIGWQDDVEDAGKECRFTFVGGLMVEED